MYYPYRTVLFEIAYLDLDYVMNYFNMVKEILLVRIGILTSCWYCTYRAVSNVSKHGTLGHIDILPIPGPCWTGTYCSYRYAMVQRTLSVRVINEFNISY